MAKQIDSWQEIADYLGVTVRTAQRWERERGLPVNRLPGNRGRVFADTRSLDEWRRRAEQGPAWWSSLTLLRWYGVFSTALLLIAAGALLGTYFARGRTEPPALYRIADRQTLIVMDSGGREVWRTTFPVPITPEYYNEPTANVSWFGDLDSDGRIETLFSYYPQTRETDGTALLCFDDTGKEKWRFIPGAPVSDERFTYSPLYVASTFAVTDLEQDGRLEVLLTSHHLSDYPNQFVVLDANGQVRGEYWHSGFLPHLATADLDEDGTQEILLGGLNNGHGSATLVVLDAHRVAGTSQQAGRLQLLGLTTGQERALVRFPRTCLNRLLEDYNRVAALVAREGTIKVVVNELDDDPNAFVTYQLDFGLAVQRAEFADHLKKCHRERRARGILDHPLTEDEIAAMRKLLIERRAGQ